MCTTLAPPRPEQPLPIVRNATQCAACPTWSREPEQHHFLEVVWGGERLAFCGAACAMRHLANFLVDTVLDGAPAVVA